MRSWYENIQRIVDVIDECIRRRDDEALTLASLSGMLHHSTHYTTRRFHEISGMPLRDYLRQRRLAFALVDVRDTKRGLLSIALDYGFSSHEAFTRAFAAVYGVTPSGYRKNPVPVVLRTRINPLDCYFLAHGGMNMSTTEKAIQMYTISVPEHTFMHVKNYESDGYFDFWTKQDALPGQDCDTICGLLDSIRGKLDGSDTDIGVYSGQIMAYLYEADGRRAECYGIRLPAGYDGPVPEQMLMHTVPAGEYMVFEHGPFDFERDGASVLDTIAGAVAAFDQEQSDYASDCIPGRLSYLYFDPQSFAKRVLPVRRQ